MKNTGVLNLSKIDKRSQKQTVTICKAQDILIPFLYICWLQMGWHSVAIVHYTFTQKQYTEQHTETEYTE